MVELNDAVGNVRIVSTSKPALKLFASAEAYAQMVSHPTSISARWN